MRTRLYIELYVDGAWIRGDEVGPDFKKLLEFYANQDIVARIIQSVEYVIAQEGLVIPLKAA